MGEPGMNEDCKSFYEKSYESSGFEAQRRYPNEELMRFMGRTLLSLPQQKRKEIRVLEAGCGSGGNLWGIAREGFDNYGIGLSAEGINLCHQMLKAWECDGALQVGDMTDLPYETNFLDAVVDVFSSNCL